MRKHSTNPQHKRQSKGNSHLNQLQTIFQYLLKHTATASMVTDARKCTKEYRVLHYC